MKLVNKFDLYVITSDYHIKDFSNFKHTYVKTYDEVIQYLELRNAIKINDILYYETNNQYYHTVSTLKTEVTKIMNHQDSNRSKIIDKVLDHKEQTTGQDLSHLR